METEKKAAAKKNHPKPHVINPEHGGGFRRMPAFWFGPGGQIEASRVAGIPTSFWVYMFVLWGELVGPGRETIADTSKRWYCEKSMTQFCVRKNAAILWSNCLAVSGFFTVSKGTYEERNPTKFFYREDTSKDEWMDFISALCLTYHNFKKYKCAPDKNVFRFAAHVAVEQYHGRGLLNPEWIKQQVKFKFIKQLEGGNIQFLYTQRFGDSFRDRFEESNDYLDALAHKKEAEEDAA